MALVLPAALATGPSLALLAVLPGGCGTPTSPLPRLLTLALVSILSSPALADWMPQGRVDNYMVRGSTGIDLYRSIGENGPKIGPTSAIAYTDFRLLWSRDYRPQPDGSCTLVSARPSLTITYRLPKAAGTLPPATKRKWETFLAGIFAHEKVHGDYIVDMV